MFAADPPHPHPGPLRSLCDALGTRAEETAAAGPWHAGAFALLAESGTLAGFIPPAHGGTGAPETALVAALTAIASRCLTTALVLTQWAAGVRIIAGGSETLRAARLPGLARGAATTTVGIAQLSTSRRHLHAPTLVARRRGGCWRLDGLCPWVTGADSSDTIVTGAVGDAGEQLFFVVPTDAPGLQIAPPLDLLALSGSRTSSVTFTAVEPADVIVPEAGGGVRTGGLATTALALGSTRAAVDLLDREARARPALHPVATALGAEAAGLEARLHEAAAAGSEPEARDRLRADANGLVVRAAQAALTATKGAGFVAGHPAGRLVREAHFFLVWSCPQTVSGITLCELSRG
ncbi:MAG: acyl-CoA dehydrogenase [Planctomycetia bacterium]|nr:acyl-CoA dehydrogenase [Planctomycetia bacterium]